MIGKICDKCGSVIKQEHHDKTLAHGKFFCSLTCLIRWEEENPP
jgi:hypothetical protein